MTEDVDEDLVGLDKDELSKLLTTSEKTFLLNPATANGILPRLK